MLSTLIPNHILQYPIFTIHRTAPIHTIMPPIAHFFIKQNALFAFPPTSLLPSFPPKSLVTRPIYS
jgi:hypothetical protein